MTTKENYRPLSFATFESDEVPNENVHHDLVLKNDADENQDIDVTDESQETHVDVDNSSVTNMGSGTPEDSDEPPTKSDCDTTSDDSGDNPAAAYIGSLPPSSQSPSSAPIAGPKDSVSNPINSVKNPLVEDGKEVTNSLSRQHVTFSTQTDHDFFAQYWPDDVVETYIFDHNGTVISTVDITFKNRNMLKNSVNAHLHFFKYAMVKNDVKSMACVEKLEYIKRSLSWWSIFCQKIHIG
ncbi:hypothetical protein BDK51DRAFT_51429 [Blyttiomyces helicus]|uniref:Uncharacterized protein n=1 Tax=Blyttiomyces helicus TaxID=388810 RepID=A0A4P9WTY7_9FUNG|nr:hypothetical protein BDK51DRAFT_51429 [Blyttiomyces helicus]|eukprot:RKO94840.1 hypothetical protein BDK51DRAFT_51429 [Blyttiomyces helicus]